MLHAHGLLKLSRRQRVHVLNATEAREWMQLRWTHGEVWCQAVETSRDPRGTISYIGRHPETLMAW